VRPPLAGGFAALVFALCFAQGAGAKDVRPAKLCGACHGPIRREWESSSMAQSWKNPVFQAFLSDAKSALGDTVLASCIVCHAPMASVSADTRFQSPVSEEGVTCNFCHNVSAVDPARKTAAYVFDSTDPDLMRGPYADADPKNAHGAVHSELHTKAEFCAACHSFTHPRSGVPIETTWTRWKSSSAAASGKPCQSCHMPSAPGQAAPVLQSKQRPDIHAHTFAGAHAAGVLDSAASLDAAVQGGRLKLTVHNRRAGHALPGGGGGMRVITLTVRFEGAARDSIAGQTLQTYGIRYADARGATPVPKWLAARVTSDREIPPDSTVVEWCPIPPKAKRAVATLTYHFIDPAYVQALRARRVDLSSHQPFVLARAERKLP